MSSFVASFNLLLNYSEYRFQYCCLIYSNKSSLRIVFFFLSQHQHGSILPFILHCKSFTLRSITFKIRNAHLPLCFLWTAYGYFVQTVIYQREPVAEAQQMGSRDWQWQLLKKIISIIIIIIIIIAVVIKIIISLLSLLSS